MYNIDYGRLFFKITYNQPTTTYKPFNPTQFILASEKKAYLIYFIFLPLKPKFHMIF